MEHRHEDAVLLTGKTLSLLQIEAVALHRRQVAIDPSQSAIVANANEVVLSYLHGNEAVYGLNRGVGLNKDRLVLADAMADFNRNLIRSHCAGTGPDASEETVRAAMLIRLNAALNGHAGLSPDVVKRYMQFLNLGIHPIIPELGSVGEADITLLSHIGLAMIGEGDVIYRGQRMPAGEALQHAGLEPLRLGPKDGLGIVSSNAFSAGKAGLALLDCVDLLDNFDMVLALSLEGIRGNVSSIDPRVVAVRTEEGCTATASRIRGLLEGSDLWNPELSRPLQDPISFRSAPHIHGAARSALQASLRQFLFHINHSDDNPCVLPEEGVIIPSAHFEIIHWILPLEGLAIALAHVAKASVQRTLRLGTPAFTGLPRFLSPDDQSVIGFSTLQKTISSLESEIRLLAQPSSLDSAVLAGDMEDLAVNAPLAVRKLERIIDLSRHIAAIEMLHAAQAIHLRGEIRLGDGVEKAYSRFREQIEPLELDKVLSDEIRLAYEMILDRSLIRSCSYSTREG
ncbi:aromatic amino acid lyase [Cohnella pontilimi]|uniref:Aromatic amino acid lyase n=1 Tax=Cohnella pontilimi TaxID=2564100 RepID=A0A4U0F7M4_9BACL|nr:aromatic amino acid ammonia-lyase [Cohnella pontilimi]TJY40685.1 aromatic amino acid lyase [Cohnella pontilimi]